MTCDALLPFARETTDSIHDELVRARALLQVADLERACKADTTSTLAAAEQLAIGQCDRVARVILTCDLAQAFVRQGLEPYRLIEFAKSETIGVSIVAEIYIALVEAKLGIHADRNLRWAEQCAAAQDHSGWLLQTQAAVARIQAVAGDWKAAQDTACRIEDPLQRLLSFCELAVGAREQGNDHALDVVHRIDGISHLIDQMRAKCILTMTAYSLGLDAFGHLRQLIELASRMRDPEQRQLAGVMVARVLARCRQLGAAMKIGRALPEPVQQEALLAICQETARAGDMEETERIASELMIPGYRDRALYCIVFSAGNLIVGRDAHVV